MINRTFIQLVRSRGIRVTTLCLIGLAATACITAPQSGRAGKETGFDTVVYAPVPAVDHHLHLTGSSVQAVLDGPPLLPPIDVPKDIALLLDQRSAAGKDAAALAQLFTDEAMVLGHNRAGWIKDKNQVAKLLVSTFGKPYWLQPASIDIAGSSANVSGYYVRGERTSPTAIGHFYLSLRRGNQGAWRIAAEVPKVPLKPQTEIVDAAAVVAQLDEAGIELGLVLSQGLWFDAPLFPMPDSYAAVRQENDWTAEQVRAFPDRLIAFCSFNPVAPHALPELERCANNPVFRGLKFSLSESGVRLEDPSQAERVKQVFAAANRHRLPIVIHLRGGPDYGSSQVQIFLDDILPAAPDIAVQIAHLWGGEAYSESALAAFARAFQRQYPTTHNLYFDVSEMWLADDPEMQVAAVGHMRVIGMDRILFGSDGKVSPLEAWRLFRATAPLTEAEFNSIALNRLPVAGARCPQRLFERIQDQVGTHRASNPPTDDASCEYVEAGR
jgi:uncharacterized protein